MLTDVPVRLSAHKALRVLTAHKYHTLASAAVQETLMQRVGKFPQFAFERYAR